MSPQPLPGLNLIQMDTPFRVLEAVGGGLACRVGSSRTERATRLEAQAKTSVRHGRRALLSVANAIAVRDGLDDPG